MSIISLNYDDITWIDNFMSELWKFTKDMNPNKRKLFFDIFFMSVSEIRRGVNTHA